MTASPFSIDPPPQILALEKIADGYKTACLLRAGFATQLFDWLNEHGSASKNDICSALQLRGAHLGFFLQALIDQGCLRQNGNLFKLAAGMENLLSSNALWSYRSQLESLMSADSRWTRLADFMTEGHSTSPRSPSDLCQQLDFPQQPLFAESRSILNTPLVLDAVNKAKNILCVDGTDGLLAALISRLQPSVTITVVVAEEHKAIALQHLETLAAGGSWTLLLGNIFELPQSNSFDLLLLAHNLYPLRKTTAAALVTAGELTAAGGQLISAHWFCQEACETAPGALDDIDKAIITDSHPLCHVEHFCERLESAGFSHCVRDKLKGPYGLTELHFGRKTQ